MKLILKCFAVLVIVLHLKVGYSKQSLTPFAVKEYITEHLVKNAIKFEVIYNSKAQELLDETLKLISDVKSYRITQVDSRIRPNGRNYFDLDFSAILFFDSFQNYLQFEDRINLTGHGPQERNLLIVCANLSTKEIERKIPNDKFQIRQYLVEEKGTISLKATTLFTPRACHKQQLIEINQFSEKKLKWKSTKFSMSKIENFYGCTLSICLYNSRPLSSLFRYSCQKGKPCELVFTGYLFGIVFELRHDLNFIADIYLRNFDQPYYHFWNGTVNTENEFETVYPPVIFDWGAFSSAIVFNSFYRAMFSSPITSESEVIIVPPGAAFTSEEKFLLPFDRTTWILFITVFVVAFAVVGLLKIFRSTSSNSFILGENVNSPGLNIFGAFMGIPQFALPTRSIARIFLMIFILFCLIMRTAYQGVFYDFLTTNPHKAPIRSIAELLESKFPLYRQMNIVNQTEARNDFVQKFQVIDVPSQEMLPGLIDQILKPSFEGTILYSSEFTNYLSKQAPRKTRREFVIIKDVFIMSFNMGIHFNPDSFLFPAFDKLITAYLESGLFEKWITDQTKHVEVMAKGEKRLPQVLSLNDLSAGFKFWLCSLLLPTIAFIGELCNFWWPRISRRLKFRA